MRVVQTVAIAIGVLTATACVNNEEYIRDLGTATDAAEISLIDAIGLAEAELGGVCVKGAFLVGGDPVFSIHVVVDSERSRVRIDPVTGEVLEITPKGSYSADLCTGGIGIVASLRVAEERIGGIAVAAVPDDDVACALETQVLRGRELWEVKVAQDGRVLEVEMSDEDGSGSD